jgi:hypothetical protein
MSACAWRVQPCATMRTAPQSFEQSGALSPAMATANARCSAAPTHNCELAGGGLCVWPPIPCTCELMVMVLACTRPSRSVQQLSLTLFMHKFMHKTIDLYTYIYAGAGPAVAHGGGEAVQGGHAQGPRRLHGHRVVQLKGTANSRTAANRCYHMRSTSKYCS